jgi:hypothetical protein
LDRPTRYPDKMKAVLKNHVSLCFICLKHPGRYVIPRVGNVTEGNDFGSHRLLFDDTYLNTVRPIVTNYYYLYVLLLWIFKQELVSTCVCPFRSLPTVVNPLKTGFLLNNIYESSPYLTGNTLRLHYKAQPVNAVWGNSRCLL